MRVPGPTARRTALVVLLLVGLSLAVLWFAGSWTELREGSRQLSAGYLVSAFLSVLASLWLAMLSWRAMRRAANSSSMKSKGSPRLCSPRDSSATWSSS